MTLTNLRATGIFCSFRLDLQGKADKDIPESSILAGPNIKLCIIFTKGGSIQLVDT